MVGMPRTPYLVGTCGFSSILILAMVTFSPSSLDNSSSAGAIMRQGPHHSAQKSTNTGFLESSTSAWKDASDTLMGMGGCPLFSVTPPLFHGQRSHYLGMAPLWVKTVPDQGHLLVQKAIGQAHQGRAVGPDQAAHDSAAGENPDGGGAVKRHLNKVNRTDIILARGRRPVGFEVE